MNSAGDLLQSCSKKRCGLKSSDLSLPVGANDAEQGEAESVASPPQTVPNIMHQTFQGLLLLFVLPSPL